MNRMNPRSLFTCEICTDRKPIAAKRFRSNGCSHPFCTDCVVRYIRGKLQNNNSCRIKCPDPDCGRTLDPRTCESLVGPSLFVRWCDLLCEEAVLGLDRCYCPYWKCSALILNECGGGVPPRKSKCPECGRLFCFACRSAWHAGFGCGENGETRDRYDVAFGRLAEARNWMRCPHCRHFVERKDGCSIIKCRCSKSFCYTCGKVYPCGCLDRYIGPFVVIFLIFSCLFFVGIISIIHLF